MTWLNRLFNGMAKGQEADHQELEPCFFNIDPFNNTFPPLSVPCEPSIDTFTHVQVPVNCGCEVFQFPLDRLQIISTEGYARCMLSPDFLKKFCRIFCAMRLLQSVGDQEVVDVYSQILSDMINTQNRKCGQNWGSIYYGPNNPIRIAQKDDLAGDIV